MKINDLVIEVNLLDKLRGAFRGKPKGETPGDLETGIRDRTGTTGSRAMDARSSEIASDVDRLRAEQGTYERNGVMYYRYDDTPVPTILNVRPGARDAIDDVADTGGKKTRPRTQSQSQSSRSTKAERPEGSVDPRPTGRGKRAEKLKKEWDRKNGDKFNADGTPKAATADTAGAAEPSGRAGAEGPVSTSTKIEPSFDEWLASLERDGGDISSTLGRADAPTSTADAPTSTADAPTSTADAPTSTADAPTSTADAPTSTADAPTSTADAPTSTADATPPRSASDPDEIKRLNDKLRDLEARVASNRSPEGSAAPRDAIANPASEPQPVRGPGESPESFADRMERWSKNLDATGKVIKGAKNVVTPAAGLAFGATMGAPFISNLGSDSYAADVAKDFIDMSGYGKYWGPKNTPPAQPAQQSGGNTPPAQPAQQSGGNTPPATTGSDTQRQDASPPEKAKPSDLPDTWEESLNLSYLLKLSGQKLITERDNIVGIIQPKKIEALYEDKQISECGSMMSPMSYSQPASLNISASASSGSEVANMLQSLMQLAGVKPVTTDMMPKGEILPVITSEPALNKPLHGEGESVPETYENTPEDPTEVPIYDPEKMVFRPNQPQQGDRMDGNMPRGNPAVEEKVSEDVYHGLLKAYKEFKSEQ